MELSQTRILIANDDGIHASGIQALERIAKTLTDDVWVVAPESEQSGAAHSLTIARPLRIRRRDERHFSVDGTPTDAVLLAVNQVLKDRKPDLVLTGVNRGGNLGEDITYSGTVAGAMEGTLLGIRSIALSQMPDPDGPTKWATAEHFAPAIIKKLWSGTWPPSVLMNVNFPDLPVDMIKGVRVGRQGRRKIGAALLERHDPRGRPYYWIDSARAEEPTREGTDLAAVNEGLISVTPLYMDFTYEPMVAPLKELFP